MAAKVSYKQGTKQTYLSLSARSSNALYFCTDTKELFKGDDLYSDGLRVVENYNALPEMSVAADGILYFCKDSGCGFVLNSTRNAWIQVVHGVDNDTIEIDSNGLLSVKTVDIAKVRGLSDTLSQIKTDVDETQNSVRILNSDVSVTGSIDYKIAQAVAAIMENPDDTMNSINELVTWCNDHATDALELSNKVSVNESDIAALESLVGKTSVSVQITNAIYDALTIDGVDKYALASNLTSAITRIAALEANAVNWDAAEQNAKNYANSLDTTTNARIDSIEGKVEQKADANSVYTREEVDNLVIGLNPESEYVFSGGDI